MERIISIIQKIPALTRKILNKDNWTFKTTFKNKFTN